MKCQFEDKTTKGLFILSVEETSLKGEGYLNVKNEVLNTIVYNTGPEQKVSIDNNVYALPAHSVLPLVANQHFVFEKPEALFAWQFNRDFYCIVDHDAEVGCAGFLFYGIQHPFFVLLADEEIETMHIIEKLCLQDMSVKDQMQGEMLRTLLKRLIITVTRVAKKQTNLYECFTHDKMDLIRQFNMLLEINFKAHHEVQFYADAMNKSPKTLTNIFGQCKYPSPSKLIQRRIISEAKRHLYYTKKPVKVVANELGFTSTAHFSRFFKLNAGINYSELKTLGQNIGRDSEKEKPSSEMNTYTQMSFPIK